MKKTLFSLVLLVAMAAAGVFLPLFDIEGEPMCERVNAPPLAFSWTKWVSVDHLPLSIDWVVQKYAPFVKEGQYEIKFLLLSQYQDGSGNLVDKWSVFPGEYGYVLTYDWEGEGFIVQKMSFPRKISAWQVFFNDCR